MTRGFQVKNQRQPEVLSGIGPSRQLRTAMGVPESVFCSRGSGGAFSPAVVAGERKICFDHA